MRGSFMCHLTKEHKLIKLGREALQIPGGEHLQLKEEVPLTQLHPGHLGTQSGHTLMTRRTTEL